MRLTYTGSGSFGGYDFDGTRIEARSGGEFTVSDKLGEQYLREQPHRFTIAGAGAVSPETAHPQQGISAPAFEETTAARPEMAPGDAAAPTDEESAGNLTTAGQGAAGPAADRRESAHPAEGHPAATDPPRTRKRRR